MPSQRTLALAIVALVASCLTACDKSSPTKPSTLPTQSPPTPSLQSILIEGPGSMQPGTKAQYKVVGQISDGTTQDLTSTTTWRSSDDGVLSIATGGEATGGKAGEVVLAAENSGKRSSLQVLVLAPGTFRVIGVVSDGGVPVPIATVDVLDGSRPILSAKTDSEGIYRFYGLSGFVELRVRAPGYPEQVRAFPVNDEVRYDFALPPSTDLKGFYVLTITAESPACPSSARNALPEDLRVRTYDAVITQSGSQLSVKLAGGSLLFGNFTGTVNGGFATFDIRGISSGFYYYYSYFDRSLDLVEQFSPISFLVISGKATASTVSTGWSGSLEGVMGIVPTISSSYPTFSAACYGKKRFVLTRR